MLELINRALAPSRRAIANMIGRAVLQAINDSPKMQELQISLLTDEVRQRAERFQNFGFTSVPKAGAEGIALFPGGDRSAPIVIVVDDRRYRLKALAEGEVAMYNEHGDKVLFKANRNIEVTTAADIVLNGANVTVNATDEAHINCDTAVVDADTSVTVNAPSVVANCDTAEVNADDSIAVTSPEALFTCSTSFTLDSPAFNFNGTMNLSTAAAYALITDTAGINVVGYSPFGDDVVIGGDLSVPAGQATVFDKVTADTIIGTTHVTAAGHSLEQHKHGGVTVGAGQTGFNI